MIASDAVQHSEKEEARACNDENGIEHHTLLASSVLQKIAVSAYKIEAVRSRLE